MDGDTPRGGGRTLRCYLGHWTIDHAYLSTRSAVPTPNGDTSNTWALNTLFPNRAGGGGGGGGPPPSRFGKPAYRHWQQNRKFYPQHMCMHTYRTGGNKTCLGYSQGCLPGCSPPWLLFCSLAPPFLFLCSLFLPGGYVRVAGICEERTRAFVPLLFSSRHGGLRVNHNPGGETYISLAFHLL